MQYFSQITNIRETEKGTDLILHIPGEQVQGKIIKYRWGCIKYKRCTICGKSPSDLHHWDAIGIGSDSRTIDDSRNRKIQLCREHHTEAHTIGRDTFGAKYHVYGIIYREEE